MKKTLDRNLVSSLLVTIWLLTPVLSGSSNLSFVFGVVDPGRINLDGSPLSFDNYNLFGGRYEKVFFQVLGLENSLLFSRSSVLTTQKEDSSGLLYSLNFLLNLPISDNLIPYVTLGLGFLRKSDDSFPDVGTNFQTNWGAGAKIPKLGGPVGLRIDFRRYGIRDILDQTLKANELSGGIMLTF